MNNFEPSKRRANRKRVASRARFAVCLLLLFAFVSGPAAARAQTPTPRTSGEQDKRGIVLKPDSPKEAATPEVSKARGTRPEIVLQTGYSVLGPSLVEYSPDARLLATATMNNSQIKLWELATGRELRTFISGTGASMGGILNGVASIAFSPDGKLIAGGGQDGSVKVWDVTTGRELRSVGGASPASGDDGMSFGGSVAFSRDGRAVAVFGIGYKVYDVATGSELRSRDDIGMLAGGGGLGHFYAQTPDASQLILLVQDAKNPGKSLIKFVDTATGDATRVVNLPDDFTQTGQSAFAATTDGRLLGAAVELERSGPGRIKLWDITGKGRARDLFDVPQGAYAQLDFSQDGRVLMATVGKTIKLWDTATGKELHAIEVPILKTSHYAEGGVMGIALAPDGRTFVSSGYDAQLIVWDAAIGLPTRRLAGGTNMAFDAAFNSDGTRLFTGAKTIWDVATGRGLRATSLASTPFSSALSRDGRLLAIGDSQSNRFTLYDAATQRPLQTFAPAEPAKAGMVTFSPDGRLLASTYQLDMEHEKNVSASAPKVSKDAIKEAAKAAAKDPSTYMSTYMKGITGKDIEKSIQSEVKIWDAATGREVSSVHIPPTNPFVPSTVGKVVFSPDGRNIAVTAMLGNTVTLWDASTGRQVRSFGAASAPGAGGGGMGMGMDMSFGFGNAISSMAFSPDGRMLITGGRESKSNNDPMAMITQMATAAAAQSGKNRRATTPDPQAIAKLMMDNTTVSGVIRLWDMATGRELRALAGHASDVKALAFSADGKTIASASIDNELKLWDTETGRELRTFKGQDTTAISLAFNPAGSLLASTGIDGSAALWDVKTGERLATLISVGDGSDWLVVTPDGLFDGSPAAWNQVLWRYDGNTFNVEPVETFFNEFFYPGLLSDITSGKRPRAPRDISLIDRRQPVVTLSTSATPYAPASARTINVRVEVKDAPAGAKDVRLFRNGSLVKVWHGDVMGGRSGATLEATVPVIAGENRLVAYAFNRDNVKSADAEALITGADSLKRAGTAYVLAVGVNSYDNAQYNLKYAVADAQVFADEIRRQQTQLGKYEHVEVVPLMDADATKANILAALKLLAGSSFALPASAPKLLAQFKPAQPEDTVVIYFAGHGTAHGNRFYLIPHDLGYAGGRDALDEAGMKSMLAHSVSDEELQSAVESLDAAQLLLVIDACNSGQALEAEEKRRGPMNSKGLAQLAYEKGMYILTAAQSYQAALEAAQLGHGLLTYALVEEGLKAMAADAEPRDGVLQAREWLDFATDRVPQMQLEKMKGARALNINIAFANGDDATADPERRSVQRPRAFYRRELESSPLILAKSPGKE